MNELTPNMKFFFSKNLVEEDSSLLSIYLFGVFTGFVCDGERSSPIFPLQNKFGESPTTVRSDQKESKEIYRKINF